ncbi:MAG: hypothetical protein P1P80_10000, partial [ANME-2 cluster archaeon]|nr:hypothetical protein [ANME-2 cluster archaeon]
HEPLPGRQGHRAYRNAQELVRLGMLDHDGPGYAAVQKREWLGTRTIEKARVPARTDGEKLIEAIMHHVLAE